MGRSGAATLGSRSPESRPLMAGSVATVREESSCTPSSWAAPAILPQPHASAPSRAVAVLAALAVIAVLGLVQARGGGWGVASTRSALGEARVASVLSPLSLARDDARTAKGVRTVDTSPSAAAAAAVAAAALSAASQTAVATPPAAIALLGNQPGAGQDLWDLIVRGYSKSHEQSVEAGDRSKGAEDVDNRPDAELALIDANRAAKEAERRSGATALADSEEMRRTREAQKQARVAERVEHRGERREQRRTDREHAASDYRVASTAAAAAAAATGKSRGAPNVTVDAVKAEAEAKAEADLGSHKAENAEAADTAPTVTQTAPVAARIASAALVSATSALVPKLSDSISSISAAANHNDSDGKGDASSHVDLAHGPAGVVHVSTYEAWRFALAGKTPAAAGQSTHAVGAGLPEASEAVATQAHTGERGEGEDWSLETSAEKREEESEGKSKREGGEGGAKDVEAAFESQAAVGSKQIEADKGRVVEPASRLVEAQRTIASSEANRAMVAELTTRSKTGTGAGPAAETTTASVSASVARTDMGATQWTLPSDKYGGVRVNNHDHRFEDTLAATGAAADVPLPTPVFHNRVGAIPGLLEHVQAREREQVQEGEREQVHDLGGTVPANGQEGEAANGQEGEAAVKVSDKLRYITYANAAYWPVAKVFIASVARNAPAMLPRLIIMLTSHANVAECAALALPHPVDCFYDADMVDILGDHVLNDGSLEAAGVSVPVEKHGAAQRLGAALRIVWCWRKVHAVYTLVMAGYSTMFMDAATVVLNDPRDAVTRHLAIARLVTLSDFGGATEQQSINTGLVAAAPGAATQQVLEQWMQFEAAATETEQAYLTWDLAPRLRREGVVIHALSQRNFPSYLTFDRRHIKGASSAVVSDTSGLSRVLATTFSPGGPAASLGGGAEVVASDSAAPGATAGGAAPDGDAGFAVHAAYCGSVKGKLAFLTRVAAMARTPGALVLPQQDELEGCDTYDRAKFLACGNAPWDGEC